MDIFIFSCLFFSSFFLALKNVKLLQRKEYRFDKMFDFFSTKEAVFFLFDFSFFTFLVSFVSILSLNYTQSFLFWTQLFAALTLFTNLVYLLFQAYSGKLHPVFTKKAGLLIALSFLTFSMFSFLAIFYFFWFISIFFLPIIVPFLWIILLYPLDFLLKSRIWKKAKIRRNTDLKNMQVIAVSGSYGKTTVKEILFQLFAKSKKTEKTLEFQNTTLSVANRLLSIPSQTEVFISEIGAYRVGDGKDMCVFTLPNSAIITGLNYQHLSLFGSEENIIKAESESLQFLKTGDIAVINMNSNLCQKIEIPKNITLIRYGLSDEDYGKNPLDYAGEEIFFDGEKTHFTLNVRGIKTRLSTNLISRGNIQNLVGCIALAHSCGLQLSGMSNLLLNLNQPNATLQQINYSWGTLIDDSHNANFDGVTNALSFVKQLNKPSIIALDEIIELGEKSVETHKKLAEHLYNLKPSKLILFGKNYANVVAKHYIFLGGKKEDLCVVNDDFKNESTEFIGDLNEFFKEKSGILLCEGFRAKYLAEEIKKK